MIGVEENTNNTENKKFPSLSQTLNEIKYRYELEEERRQSLENKAGILIGFIGVIIAIIFSVVNDLTILYLLVPFFILIGLALTYAFFVIRLKKVDIPHKEDTEDFYQYAEMDKEKVEDDFLRNYIVATEKLENINDEKVARLKRAFKLTLGSIVYLIGSTFIIFTV